MTSDSAAAHEPDPFKLLRLSNPVPEAALDMIDIGAARRAELLDEVFAADPDEFVVIPRPHQRRRWARFGAAGAVVLLAAAWVWAWTTSPTDPLSVSCFAAADLDADRTQVEPDGRDYRDLCSEAWADGRVESPTGEAPSQLEACVLDSGSVGVFPAAGRQPCGALGLDTATAVQDDPGPQDPGTLAALQSRLIERFHGRCAPHDAAEAIVEEELERFSVADWDVVVGDRFPAERPCASIAVDAAGRTVTIVAVPRPPSGT